MKRTILSAALLAGPASADPFTYADERCRNAVSSGVICTANSEDTTLGQINGYVISFSEFVEENSSLRDKSVTPETVAPAYRLYVTKVKESD